MAISISSAYCEDIPKPKGRLGFPIGTIVKIEGTRIKEALKGSPYTLEVLKLNGQNINPLKIIVTFPHPSDPTSFFKSGPWYSVIGYEDAWWASTSASELYKIGAPVNYFELKFGFRALEITASDTEAHK